MVPRFHVDFPISTPTFSRAVLLLHRAWRISTKDGHGQLLRTILHSSQNGDQSRFAAGYAVIDGKFMNLFLENPSRPLSSLRFNSVVLLKLCYPKRTDHPKKRRRLLWDYDSLLSPYFIFSIGHSGLVPLSPSQLCSHGRRLMTIKIVMKRISERYRGGGGERRRLKADSSQGMFEDLLKLLDESSCILSWNYGRLSGGNQSVLSLHRQLESQFIACNSIWNTSCCRPRTKTLQWSGVRKYDSEISFNTFTSHSASKCWRVPKTSIWNLILLGYYLVRAIPETLSISRVLLAYCWWKSCPIAPLYYSRTLIKPSNLLL